MTTFSIIVAADEKNGIGSNNQLPWHISEDLKNFKRLTSGKVVLMGRKTWGSLPIKPLPNRINIVISNNSQFADTGAVVFHSLTTAIDYCEQFPEVYVIGGAAIYQQFFNLADNLFLTRVHRTFNTDATLIGFIPDQWELVSDVKSETNSTPSLPYSFQTYRRKKQATHEH